MAAHTRTKTQREEHRAEIAKMDRRGYTQREMAAALGISQKQVWLDLKLINRRYVETQLAEHGLLIRQRIEQLREVLCEAWRAFEKSRDDKDRSIQETIRKVIDEHNRGRDVGAAVDRIWVQTVKEARLAGNEYLRTILDVLKELSKLQGLYPSEELRLAGIQSGEPVRLKVEYEDNWYGTTPASQTGDATSAAGAAGPEPV